MLEVQNIHSGYGSVPVLRDVSVSVNPGEIVLIVGENGAGKSTLLRTIGGFIKPEKGSVKLNGVDVTGHSPESLVRSGLRLVLDGHRVFPEISVYDNLRLGAAARPSNDKAGFNAAVDNILSVFPILKDKLHNYASGTAIIIVEQHIDIALPVSDRAVVIERGQVKLSCAAKDLKAELQKASEARAASGLPT
jgi:branched-chain amino acid transport system ATP-binding protein